MRRLPKFGFNNANYATYYDVLNIGDLATLGSEITPEVLEKAGLLRYGRVKILAKGELKKAINVKAHKFSGAAKAAIEKAGGKAEVIE